MWRPSPPSTTRGHTLPVWQLTLCFNRALCHEGVLGKWRYSSIHSLTSALDGGEWSASRSGRFTPRERASGTHWIGGWVGPGVTETHLTWSLLLYMFKTWYLNLREEWNLHVFESLVLRGTFVSKELEEFYVKRNFVIRIDMTMYPKVSGLAAWSENCKWHSSLPLGAVLPLFCESV
jgi:hypothetical protein